MAQNIDYLLAVLSIEDKVKLVVGVGLAKKVPGVAGETRSVGV